MSHSPLLQLARESIEEVLQAHYKIDKTKLLEQYPLLNEKVPVSIKIFLQDELRGFYTTKGAELSLVESIAIGAKKAAFEDKAHKALTLSEYFLCYIEISLETESGVISHKERAFLENRSS
ncbi:MAG: AMMECR1 domain-containing protein [Campylobacterales bacterium]|nr:AMMECR1 domain-containing protein [Campylobacterales bacterium]